jgi:hypothetical protein
MNCPQHIPRRTEAADVAAALAACDTRITALEVEVARLQAVGNVSAASSGAFR